ncbi:MAG: propanediol utilization microcompartment protein PduB, partial [Lentisphaeria bacterium]|nr:propanediol utilization microcompartment protein PduB [Lentisphaeria bacterium]
MNNRNVYKAIDPKAGTWEKIGELSSDRYGDANLFADGDRLYLYFGWSQIMPFQVVELDTKTFKEKAEPIPLFFSDIKNHGFEARKPEDVIYSIFGGRRDYGPEEFPWIEGPWMTKHNGKYYLQYAAIGLEFISYSHGVYVSDSPTGPFVYSEHNPLTFKTSGFEVGAGHGSTVIFASEDVSDSQRAVRTMLRDLDRCFGEVYACDAGHIELHYTARASYALEKAFNAPIGAAFGITVGAPPAVGMLMADTALKTAAVETVTYASPQHGTCFSSEIIVSFTGDAGAVRQSDRKS